MYVLSLLLAVATVVQDSAATAPRPRRARRAPLAEATAADLLDTVRNRDDERVEGRVAHEFAVMKPVEPPVRAHQHVAVVIFSKGTNPPVGEPLFKIVIQLVKNGSIGNRSSRGPDPS